MLFVLALTCLIELVVLLVYNCYFHTLIYCDNIISMFLTVIIDVQVHLNLIMICEKFCNQQFDG